MSIIEAILGTSPEGQDRRLNILVVLAASTAIVVVIGALVFGPKIVSSASTTQAIKDGNEVTACRAGYRTQVDDVSSKLQAHRARLDVLTSEGLAASVDRNADALRAAVRASAEARIEVTTAAAELDRVTEAYSEIVRLSRTHPSRFLDLCRKDSPL